MEIEDIKNLKMVRSLREKLFYIFKSKWEEIEIQHYDYDRPKKKWKKYLASIDGLIHVDKFSVYTDTHDYVLDLVSEKPFDGCVIHDPCDEKCLIVLERELADKILVLGAP